MKKYTVGIRQIDCYHNDGKQHFAICANHVVKPPRIVDGIIISSAMTASAARRKAIKTLRRMLKDLERYE